MRVQDSPLRLRRPVGRPRRSPPLRFRRRPRLGWRGTLVPLALLVALLPAPAAQDLPPPISVKIDGEERALGPGATVAEARRAFRLRPRPGHLLDVRGRPVERGIFPGFIRVNGDRAAPSRILTDGDRVEVVDGRHRYEPVTVEVVPIAEGTVPNPQTHLGFTPGDQVITKGAVSGKLLSTAFRPTGKADVPRAVALTFDDGPSPLWTPRILRILERFDVKATFFMVGSLVERYPGLARQVARAGMAVGNHSFGHLNAPPFAQLPSGRLRGEVAGGHRALADVGITSELFRPPAGSWNGGVVDAARSMGERTVLWSIDSEDWRGAGPALLARRVLDQAERGSIIVLHDGGGNRAATVEALPRIIRGLRDRGFRFVTL